MSMYKVQLRIANFYRTIQSKTAVGCFRRIC